MPFLSSSDSTPTAVAADSSSDIADGAVPSSSAPSSSVSTSRLSEMWNYLWIPFLISLSRDIVPSKADSAILLPSQLDHDSPPSTCPLPDQKLYYRPVIGILSHPGDGASGRLSNATGASYIAASYVKFVESAGARVIPLIYNEPLEVLYQKLELVNGVLFTGGWAKRGLYFEVAQKIFQRVLEKNDAGDHFPLYAICLGFEILSMAISKYGISPERFQENSELSSFFNILTTCTDEDDKVYVSTVQARRYPVTGFQWHPEKNAFEWGLTRIPHSEDAIQVTQHAANFLVSEARKSLNRPSPQKVLDNLIYNYSPTYCGKAGRGYDEVYIFTRSSM
ncbi:Peptidase C26, gamma-glutamyl hydrolase [Trema orientale]|uniref:folate gamma-glutamyl hydrolase n=1 Tax=Trema orientale TaxID=63057 RepID=A0A2P5FL13_TREOI|nr:Peptidase C26, gamma-glutamyl hydrolase [Trema orientale]